MSRTLRSFPTTSSPNPSGPPRPSTCCNTSRSPTPPTASPPPRKTKLVGDNKVGARIDQNTRWGNLSAYYFIDQYNLNNPYPTAQGGANLPGFNATSNGRSQLISFGLTKALGPNTVNEAHFSYMRYFNVIGKPVGGVGPSLASQGFVSGAGTLGIVPLDPKH